MGSEDFEKELSRRPFLPFRIVTTTGKSYEITERDVPMIMVSKRCVFINRLLPESDPYFERHEIVSLFHVVRLEPIPLVDAAK